MNLIYIVFVGITAGFLAGQIMKGRGFGWFINLLLGIAGSFIGHRLFAVLNIYPRNGIIGTIVTATIGAVVLIFVVNLLKGKK